jgi:hypothetical protein
MCGFSEPHFQKPILAEDFSIAKNAAANQRARSSGGPNGPRKPGLGIRPRCRRLANLGYRLSDQSVKHPASTRHCSGS